MGVVITGSPGVGKHTVGRLVAGRTGLELVDINAVAAKAGLVGAGGDVDTERLAGAVAGMLPKDHVAVGHLAPHVFSVDQARLAIVLRRDPYDLLGTYKERGYSDSKAVANAGSEVLGVIAHESFAKFGKNALQLDVTARGAAGAADAIVSCMAHGPGSGKPRGDAVDWLGMVYGRGDLARFFGNK